MTSYDAWKTTEPFEDAPLHDSCAVCFTGELRNYHEQVEGVCRRCYELDEMERLEQEECGETEVAA